MRFEIRHELDAPLDTVELATLSPDLGRRLAERCKAFESIETVEHVLERGTLRRVLRFQANAPLPALARYAPAREAMCWCERFEYRLADHASSWCVELPREEWRRYFSSEGTYRLERLEDGRTARIVEGTLTVAAGVLAPVIERLALVEVRRTYDAEAETLRELSSL